MNRLLLLLLLAYFGSVYAQELPSDFDEEDVDDSTTIYPPNKNNSNGDARDAATREVGRVIGRKIGQEIVSKMTLEDRISLLNAERAALRGHLLQQYIFERATNRNQFRGYIIVTREGENNRGQLCRELEMDLIVNLVRYFERSVGCLGTDGEWRRVSPQSVRFNSRGPTGPDVNRGGGGWLPPL